MHVGKDLSYMYSSGRLTSGIGIILIKLGSTVAPITSFFSMMETASINSQQRIRLLLNSLQHPDKFSTRYKRCHILIEHMKHHMFLQHLNCEHITFPIQNWSDNHNIICHDERLLFALVGILEYEHNLYTVIQKKFW